MSTSIKTPPRSTIAKTIELIDEASTSLALPPRLDSATRRALRADALVAPALIDLAIAVAQAHPSLVGITFDAEAAQHKAYIESLEPIAAALRQLARQLGDNLLVRRAALGHASANVYAHLKVLARTPHAPAVAEPLDRMAAIRGKFAKRTRSTKESSTQSPAANS